MTGQTSNDEPKMNEAGQLVVEVSPGEAVLHFGKDHIHLMLHPNDQDIPLNELPPSVSAAFTTSALFIQNEASKAMLARLREIAEKALEDAARRVSGGERPEAQA